MVTAASCGASETDLTLGLTNDHAGGNASTHVPSHTRSHRQERRRQLCLSLNESARQSSNPTFRRTRRIMPGPVAPLCTGRLPWPRPTLNCSPFSRHHVQKVSVIYFLHMTGCVRGTAGAERKRRIKPTEAPTGAQ